MRKVIFKLEIECLLLRYSIADSKKWEILKTLFENPMDITKQYLLKKAISSSDRLARCLNALNIDNGNQFIADVQSLFEVTDDLELPDTLREQLARKEPIAIFAGAGVSKLIGIPLWIELAREAISYLRVKGISFAESQRIIAEQTTPKQKMSTFHDICPKPEARAFYERHFVIQNSSDRNPYDLLVKLREMPKFTSNLDHEFWNALERTSSAVQSPQKADEVQSENVRDQSKPIQIVSGFGPGMQIIPNAIYQLHGSYKNLEKYSIVTMRDYLLAYFQDQNLPQFLKNVFKKYAVIFIGYGMEEFEVLQHLVGDHMSNGAPKRHHILIGTYLNDPTLLGVKKEYFGNLGINAHGYYLDFHGYDRLYEVIDSWVKKITNGGFYPQISEFDDVEL